VVAVQDADQHREAVDVTTASRPKILFAVANPRTATTTGWPVGFWPPSSPTPTAQRALVP
jgi:hypothetical protein